MHRPDRDAQPAGIREVDRPLAARHRGLLEVHLEVRAVLRAPVPHPPLERPHLAGLKSPRKPLA